VIDKSAIFHRELAKNRGFLRQIRQAQTRALVNRPVLHRRAIDQDLPRIGAHQAHYHVEGGGFAGAVGAEQAHHLTCAHGQVHFFDHQARAIALLQAAGLESGFRH
jgi:hypothetical protein